MISKELGLKPANHAVRPFVLVIVAPIRTDGAQVVLVEPPTITREAREREMQLLFENLNVRECCQA